jgi:hypothetical protein
MNVDFPDPEHRGWLCRRASHLSDAVPSWDRPEARLAVTENGGCVRYFHVPGSSA